MSTSASTASGGAGQGGRPAHPLRPGGDQSGHRPGRDQRPSCARAEGGPFRSIFDFAHRVDGKSLNKRVVEALIKAGAFDRLHPLGLDGRAQLLASVGLAFEYADNQAAHADQGGLFDFGDEADAHGSSTREPTIRPSTPGT